MTDFGTAEERAVALRVALAAKELNRAISDAASLRLSVKINVLTGHKTACPIVQVGMERRTMILPTALQAGLRSRDAIGDNGSGYCDFRMVHDAAILSEALRP